MEIRRFKYSYLAEGKDRPKQYPEHEPVVLEMNVVHDQEAGVHKQRGGNDSLHGRVRSPANEPGSCQGRTVGLAYITDRRRAAPSTNSVAITVVL
jgi:hypothetical protein